MSATDLVQADALGLAQLIRVSAVSAVEVVDAHLRRIEEVNPAINAVVQLDTERASARARAADAALARGEDSGPLHGAVARGRRPGRRARPRARARGLAARLIDSRASA
jgi:Asp-tRNA(Asn)/Glu-tRNA(Gln) amidotransferase A subunit family amidase